MSLRHVVKASYDERENTTESRSYQAFSLKLCHHELINTEVLNIHVTLFSSADF